MRRTALSARRAGRAGVVAASAGAALGAGHAALNAALLRRPPADPPPVDERVSLLLPVRNEAHRVGPTLRSLLAQRGLPDHELIVLDDGSTDGTADLVASIGGPRVRVLTGQSLPAGWLGKPWACEQLAEAATGSVLVFVDADVELAPHAVAATVALLRERAATLVSPYPRQRAHGVAERLVQPLLTWSWLTFLPLRLAESSPRTSLAAANGQLLCVDAAGYAAAGGHAAVADAVLEDVELLRAVKRSGRRGLIADGTGLAHCRMYAGARDLAAGYGKSLWTVPAGAPVLLGALYLVPPLAALRGSRVGLAGYAAAVAGRVVCAARTGQRTWPDPLAHPLSVAALVALWVRSRLGHRRGTLTWKDRALAGRRR